MTFIDARSLEPPPAHDPLRLLDDDEVIGGEIANAFLQARRPGELDELHRRRAPQSEMKAEIAVRVVARTAHHLVDLRPPARGDLHPCPDGGAVRLGADALDQDRVLPVPAIVAQQGRRTIQVVDDDVDVAVVVEIADGAAASEIRRRHGRPRARRHVDEAAVAGVAIEQVRLPVGEVQLAPVQLRIHVTVGDEDVLPAVVVEVEEVHAKADVLPVDAEAGPEARDLERTRTVVPVQRGDLLGEVRADDVEPTVGVVVSYTDAHASERDAGFVERASRPGPPSRGTSRRDCSDTAGSAPCRTRRRCPASRHCRNPPPPRPFRTTPSGASCCRRTPSSKNRGAARCRTPRTHPRTSRRRDCDRAGWCRRRSRADRRARQFRCSGNRHCPRGAGPARGRRPRSWRRRDRGARRDRSPGNNNPHPIDVPDPRRPRVPSRR